VKTGGGFRGLDNGCLGDFRKGRSKRACGRGQHLLERADLVDHQMQHGGAFGGGDALEPAQELGGNGGFQVGRHGGWADLGGQFGETKSAGVVGVARQG